jgi:hypothetical protein
VTRQDPGFGVGLIAYGLVDLALTLWRPVRRALIQWRAGRLVNQACEFTASGEGIAWRQGGASGQMAWSELTSVAESSRTLGFKSGGVFRFALPKRAFGSAEEGRVFRDFATSQIAAVHTPRGQ